MAQFSSRFSLGEAVIIDNDKSLVCRVTGFLWRSHCQIEVSWVHCGALYTQWIEEWRLSPSTA
jgi:hypothetical protein